MRIQRSHLQPQSASAWITIVFNEHRSQFWCCRETQWLGNCWSRKAFIGFFAFSARCNICLILHSSYIALGGSAEYTRVYSYILLYCFWSEGELRYARSINVTSTILWIGRIDSTLHRAADCSRKENKEWPKKPSQSSSICHLNERALLSDQNQRFCQVRSITRARAPKMATKQSAGTFSKQDSRRSREENVWD